MSTAVRSSRTPTCSWAGRGQFMSVIDQLEAAVAELAAAQALRAWAREPGGSYKLRAGPAVPLVFHSSDPLPISDVIDALRKALDLQQRQSLPSPFGATAEQADEVEPVPAA
jgi:hypothetical protein